jgi:RNA polymerase sigma-70 factor (ECF subfamily)
MTVLENTRGSCAELDDREGERDAGTSTAASEDSRAVAQVLRGDRDRFRELVERYQARVFGLTLRLVGNRTEAEDLTQQAFVEAYGGLDRFDPGRRFATWLFRIAVNNCKDHLKSHKRRERPFGEERDQDSALFASPRPTPEQALASSQVRRIVSEALDRLAPKYRVPLVLKDIEGLSYEEMREVLGLPITTLKIRVVRARARMEELLSWTQEKS